MDYEVLYTRLTSHAGLSALTGNRWYPLVLPQKPTLPAGTYQRISDVPLGETTLTLHQERVQFNCYGQSYIDARSVATQVVAALEGFTDTDQATQLKAAWQDNAFDYYEPETELYVVPVDVMLILA